MANEASCSTHVIAERQRRRILGAGLILAIVVGLSALALVLRPMGGTGGADREKGSDEVMEGGLPAVAKAPRLLPLSREEAIRINETRPSDAVPLIAARPFAIGKDRQSDPRFLDALECMTQAIYYEAANEPSAGQRAVAQVVLNRVRHPAFPHSVCGVVYEGSHLSTGCQFTFTCDGSLLRRPSKSGWARAQAAALAALNGWVEQRVGLATNYHADYVVPYWASSLSKIATIGRHIFYGNAVLGRAAFSASYAFDQEHAPNQARTDEMQALSLDGWTTPESDGVTVPEVPGLLPQNRERRVVADVAGTLPEKPLELEADRKAGNLDPKGAESRLIVD